MQRLKARVGRLKARVRRLKTRVETIKPWVRTYELKEKNSYFKTLNFTSYKNFYFHWLVNSELKPHTKVLKNLFHKMAFKKHIWALYCHHILAAGKLRNIDSNKDLKCTIIMPLIWDNVTETKCNIFGRVWL